MRIRIQRKAYQWYYKLYCNIALFRCTSTFVQYRWPLTQCCKQQNQGGNGLDHNGFPKGFSLILPSLFALIRLSPFFVQTQTALTNGFQYNGSHWLNDSTHIGFGRNYFPVGKMFMPSFYRANGNKTVDLPKKTDINIACRCAFEETFTTTYFVDLLWERYLRASATSLLLNQFKKYVKNIKNYCAFGSNSQHIRLHQCHLVRQRGMTATGARGTNCNTSNILQKSQSVLINLWYSHYFFVIMSRWNEFKQSLLLSIVINFLLSQRIKSNSTVSLWVEVNSEWSNECLMIWEQWLINSKSFHLDFSNVYCWDFLLYPAPSVLNPPIDRHVRQLIFCQCFEHIRQRRTVYILALSLSLLQCITDQ